MPKSYPRDEIFSPHLTAITDSYNPLLELCLKYKRFEKYVFVFNMKNMHFVSRDQLLKKNVLLKQDMQLLSWDNPQHNQYVTRHKVHKSASA